MTKRRLTAGVMVLAGVAFGVFVLLAILQNGGRASAANLASCNESGSTASVVVGDNATTLSVRVGAQLFVNGSACTGALPLGTTITTITLSVPAPTLVTPSTIIDETGSGGAIPCTVAVNGATGAGPLQITGAAGKDLTAGVDSGHNNELDPSACGSPKVTVSGMTSYVLLGGANSVPAGGANSLTLSVAGPTGGGFSGPATLTTTLNGSLSGMNDPDTFVAGDGPETFITNSPASTLDFSGAFPSGAVPGCAPSCVLTANSSMASVPVPGSTPTTNLSQYTGAVTNGGTSPLATYDYTSGGADFTAINGLSSGSTSFYPDVNPPSANTYSLSGNKVSVQGAASGTNSYVVVGTGLSFVGGSGDNTFTAELPPSNTVGNNTFVAGSGTDHFYAHGTGNTMDFSPVLTSSSAPLAIDLAGVPETVNGTTLTLRNGQAGVGSTLTDTFLNGPGSTSASNFTTITGATTGNTQFLIGGASGLNLVGHGPANSASFLGDASSPSGVVVNLSGSPITTSTSTQISPTISLSNFTVSPGQVLVDPPSGGSSCGGTSPPACDQLSGVTTVSGPSVGYSSFYAGSAPAAFTFSDSGDHNTFVGGSGSDTFTSAGNVNTFVAGSGSATFNESTPQQGANNTIDFSAVPVGNAAGCTGQPCSLAINVSGSPAAVSNDQAANLTAAQQPVSTYSFGTGGPDFTTFIGAAGGRTTFDGGSGAYTYTGQGNGNTLDFSAVSSAVASTLTFDVTHSPSPQAILGQVPETFSGITNLVGLASGGTQFQGGSSGGYTFKGNGSGNQATFTSQGPSNTLSVTVTAASGITGGTVDFSLTNGTELCPKVPVTLSGTPASGQAGCSASVPAGTTQVLAVYTPPTASNQSPSAVLLPVTTAPASIVASSTSLSLLQTVNQGQTDPLSARITSTATLPAGTVTFSEAGNPTPLCTASVPGGPSPQNAGCSSFSFASAGTFDVLAVYTPSSGGVSGSADVKRVTVNSQQVQTTTVQNSISCSPFFFGFSISNCTFDFTVTTAAGGSLPGGSVTVTSNGAPLCSVSFPDQGPSSFPASCISFSPPPNGAQVVATYTPTDVLRADGSAGVGTISGLLFSDPITTTTQLSAPATTVTQGAPVTLQATVQSTGGALPLQGGGTVVFSVAGIGNLCNPVSVQGGSSTPPPVTCTASFGSGHFDDVVATYNPPSSSSIGGSAAELPFTVTLPTPSTSMGKSNFDPNPGIVANLSGSAVESTTQVSVGGGAVLVAAPPNSGPPNPPSPPYSCSGSPLPSYCDSLINVTSVNGSSQGDNTFVAGSGAETFGDTGVAGTDAVDFSNVATSGTTALTVNASGAPLNGQTNDTAVVGGVTYNFTTGGSDFKTFTGSANGNTTFLAGGAPNYSFTGAGPNDSIDFSSVNTPVAVDLHNGPFPATTVPNVTLSSGPDTITGLTTVTGSGAGHNTFTAGPAGATYTFTGNGDSNDFIGRAGPDVFTSNGNHNTFTAGAGNATFNDSGANNIVDLSALPGSAVVDVAGGQVGGTANDTATSSGSTYTFTSFGTAPTTFNASLGGTTFYAGSAGDTFRGGTAADTLSFFNTPSSGPLSISPVAACPAPSIPPLGQATLGSITEQFCGIEVFEGLANGNTTFVTDGTAGLTFTAHGSNNAADFSADTNPITADLNVGTVQVGLGSCSPLSNCDSISGITSVLGSSVGGNTFIAGPGSETFGDTGTHGHDAIDFSHVATSPTTVLAVNVSGGPVNGQSNDTATVGSATYSFSRGGSGFITFTGSVNGNTSFLAGSAAGYRFSGSSGNNLVDLSAAIAGLTVDLSGYPALGTVNLGGSCPTACDTLSGLTTVIGSSSGGNHFLAGGTSGSYNFTGNGNLNTFTGGAGPDVFSSNGSNNTFAAGTGSATFNDPGANNTIDFTAVPGTLTVNVAGVQDGATATDTASSGGSLYMFTDFGNAATTLKGSGAGGTTFDAGPAADTFVGNGSTANPNALSFAFTPSNGPLSISPTSLTCPTFGQAMLGSIREPFCGIEVFKGLANGNTTFMPSGGGGYTFAATGTNDTADFSANPNPITANLANVTAYGVGPGEVQVASGACATLTNCDTVTGVTSVLGSRGGHNTFVAGTGSETFADTGGMGGDAIDFSSVVTSPTTPLTVNVSGTPVAGVSNDNAGIPSATYNFSNGGANFTSFTGSGNGFTKFVAPGATGGYTFCAIPACGPGSVPSDTADLSANLNGITANLSPSTEGGLNTGQVSVGAAAPDTIGDMTTVIGSPFGANSFYGGLTGTTFTSTGSSNTLSYVGVSSLAPHGAGVNVDLNGDHVALRCITPSPCTPGGSPPLPPLPTQTDSFSFGSGPGLSVVGSPGSDSFVIGTTAVSLAGGGGSDTLDLSQVPSSGMTGATVNLAPAPGAPGTVSDASIGGVSFAPGCGDAAQLCVTSVIGTHNNDTFVPNAGSLAAGAALSIMGNGGNDTMDLSAILTSATVTMPTPSLTPGTVRGSSSGSIKFTGVQNVIGTGPGGDTFTVGSGTESFTENGATPGTLDFSKVGTPTAGVTVSVGNLGGPSSGSVTSSPSLGVADTFTNIGTFNGTAGPDTFQQSGTGMYTFNGRQGSNILDLSNAPSDVTVNLMPSAGCTGGVASDGTATTTDLSVNDTFTCIMQVITAGTQTFKAFPGQQTMLNGGGNGTLELENATAGVTVTLPVGSHPGKVSGPDYNFNFTGMSTVDGTPFDDLFIPGSGNVTVMGGGGNDGVSYLAPPAGPVANPTAVVANLSGATYTVPAGFSNAGTPVAQYTAIGGNGGTITLDGISNLIGTSRFNDILISGGAGSSGSLVSGGSGNDRFVMTGGDAFVAGGTGAGTTLDLSVIPGQTSFNLGNSSPQDTGAGTVTVAPHSVHNVIASAGGSQLQAGNGIVTLFGGPGNDWLAAGTGTQTLIGGGGNDTLVAGVGNQALQGGAQPVTFVPGQGSDTLTTQGSGNTLDYSKAPAAAQVNLSSQLFLVPQGEPMAGTVLNGLTAKGGSGATVNLSQANITTVNGSSQADVLVSGSTGDVINGGGGNDLIVANSGNNILTAGSGTATRFLFDGTGNNVIKGGGAATVDFSQAPAGVFVNLQTGPPTAPTQSGTATGGFGGSQSLTGVLNVIGTNLNDTLVAGAPGGTVTGLNGGGDVLQSGPFGGNFLVSGGSASDTFCAESTCAVGGTRAGGGNTMTGGFGNDTFFVRNGAFDAIDGGGGFNQAQVDSFDSVTNIQNLLP